MAQYNMKVILYGGISILDKMNSIYIIGLDNDTIIGTEKSARKLISKGGWENELRLMFKGMIWTIQVMPNVFF